MLSVESKWTVFEKETYVVSVMNERLETDAIRDKKDNRPLLHQKRRHKLTERNPQKVQESVRTGHVIIGTFPSVSITSLNPNAHTVKNVESDTLRLMGAQRKVEEKWCEGSVDL